MAEILEVNDSTVKIGDDSGKIVNLPIAALHFPDPKIGDKVKVYKGDKTVIVKRIESTSKQNTSDRRYVNKIVYILLTFFIGFLGVHRFMRGQVGIGICMILFGWLTLGIWWLVDFIISLVKLSKYDGDDYVFTPDGRWTK